MQLLALRTSGFYPYILHVPGERSLRPVKNKGDGFDKVADKTFPYFHWANYTLNKTSPIFLLPLIFQSTPLKTFSLEG